jgi:hypothetical protein
MIKKVDVVDLGINHIYRVLVVNTSPRFKGNRNTSPKRAPGLSKNQSARRGGCDHPARAAPHAGLRDGEPPRGGT